MTFDNTPGRRLVIGWMCNWQYAAELPTRPWHSSMTLPRELTLTTVGDVVRLVQKPVAALRAHGQQVADIRDRLLRAGSELSVGAVEVLIGFDVDTAEFRASGECVMRRLTVTEMSVADRRGDAGRTDPWD